MLGEYHAALGELIFAFEGTLERFTGDGLMVFFNDPVPCPDAPQRAVRMAVAMRDAGADAGARRGADAGHDLAFGVGHRPGLRHARAGSASRAATTTPRSAASPTSPPGCAPRPRRGQILVSQRVLRGCRGPWSRPTPSGPADAARASADPCDAYDVRARRRRGSRMTRRWTPATSRPSDLAELDEARAHALRRAAGAGCRRSGTRCGSTTPDESVVVVPSITPGPARVRQRRHDAGHRGALPVPAAAAAPAAAADDLRHLDADRPTRSSSTTSRCCPG